MDETLYKKLAAWIDAALSGSVPEEVEAFNFNLYDGPTEHDLEIIGAPSYTPGNPDWACDDVFRSMKPRFELPHATVGSSWESGLSSTAAMLLRYVNSERRGAATLKSARAVCVGFVDGELQEIWVAGK